MSMKKLPSGQVQTITFFIDIFSPSTYPFLKKKTEGDQKVYMSLMEKYASIFPFKTNRDLPTCHQPVTELFDNNFLKKIREFVQYHFCDSDTNDTIDFEYLKNLFLANIDHFKREHFRNSPSYEQLTRIIGLGSNNWRKNLAAPEFLSEYLKDFIRLSEDGIEWYKYIQTKFNEVCKSYNKEFLLLPEKSDSYFRYLPEINCCELLLLLESDFYRLNHRNYEHLFKKYLFFFGHCIQRAEPNVVLFIDETLFSCLQFKKKYLAFRGKIFDLQWELWMMTLVNRRKYPIPKNRQICVKLDQKNLKNVVDYILQIPGIDDASFYYSEAQHPRSKIFLLLDDVIFILGFTNVENYDCFSRQILKSALLSREITKIIFYNPCLGEESTIHQLPKKEEILDFIRKNNEWYPAYPEKFFMKGVTNYFVNIPHNVR